ncbi:MAG: hypothetical protein U0W40_10255 [Acidimicrobiia bacterium]
MSDGSTEWRYTLSPLGLPHCSSRSFWRWNIGLRGSSWPTDHHSHVAACNATAEPLGAVESPWGEADPVMRAPRSPSDCVNCCHRSRSLLT